MADATLDVAADTPQPAAEPAKPPSVRYRNKKLLFNERQVQKLALKGMSDGEIAATQGVQRTTIMRYLDRVIPDRGALEAFKANRADILAELHRTALHVKQRIIGSLATDPDLEALKAGEKANLLRAVNESGGTDFDKERLERGQSTQNVAVLQRLMAEARSGLYDPPSQGSAPNVGAQPDNPDKSKA